MSVNHTTEAWFWPQIDSHLVSAAVTGGQISLGASSLNKPVIQNGQNNLAPLVRLHDDDVHLAHQNEKQLPHQSS